MKTIRHAARQFEFSFPERETSVLVEASEEGVLIRATRDTFSPQRMRSFIRELEAEGFIYPDECWDGSRSLIVWIVDGTWVKPKPAEMARTNLFMIRLLLAGLLLWGGLLAGLFSSVVK